MNQVRETFRRIIEERGPDACKDPWYCEGVLRVACPDSEREAGALVRALDAGVGNQVIDAMRAGRQAETEIERAAERLVNEHEMSGEEARWTVETIALGLEVIEPNLLSAMPAMESDASFSPAPGGTPQSATRATTQPTAQLAVATKTATPAKVDDEEPVNTYVGESLLMTLCCCPPAGIVGLYFASQADAFVKAGEREKACAAAEKANSWLLVGIVLDLIFFAFYAWNRMTN